MKALDREILRLALPSILANITVPLVGLVDTAVAGHLRSLEGSSAAFIGGISAGAMILNVLYWNFAFLRASTGGLTAQAYGRLSPSELRSLRSLRPLPSQATGPSPCPCPGVDTSSGDSLPYAQPEYQSILSRALKLALGISAILLVLGWPLSKLSLLFRSATPGVAVLAAQYILIRIWAAPATLSLMALKGWFIGMQDSVSSMLTDLTVNVVNIAASIILTLGIGNWQGMGFAGIPLGTVIAQWTGFILALAICRFRYRIPVFRAQKPAYLYTDTTKSADSCTKTSLNVHGMKAFFRLNADLFIRSLCMTGIYFGYTILAAQYGETLLACANIMMNLLMIFSYFTDGFAYAGEALSGRFIGASDEKMLRRTVAGTFKWSMGVALLWVLIYLFAGPGMLGLMTSDEGLIDSCARYLPWLLAMPPIGCAAFTWDGIYIGATSSSAIRNSMIWALAAFVGTWFGGLALLGGTAGSGGISATTAIHLLMAAYFAHLLARTLYLSVKWDAGSYFAGQS